jgi:hypothetical protein
VLFGRERIDLTVAGQRNNHVTGSDQIRCVLPQGFEIRAEILLERRNPKADDASQ